MSTIDLTPEEKQILAEVAVRCARTAEAYRFMSINAVEATLVQRIADALTEEAPEAVEEPEAE
jgi:hypothetical protein